MISGKVVLGALAGIAAGALVGLLLAPDKGSKIRSKIVKQGEDYLDSMKGQFNSLLESISGKFDGGKVDVGDSKKANSKEAKRDLQPAAS